MLVTARLDCRLLEIGEMVISAFIGLMGLGPASGVFTCSLLDRLLIVISKISICPHMTSYSNTDVHQIVHQFVEELESGRLGNWQF